MPNEASVTRELIERGELWQPAPGLTALRGAAARLRDAIARELRALCVEEAADEWHVPPALPFDTLQRADYFASFPQWLTAAAHLDGEDRAHVAAATDAAAAALAALRPVATALQPAVCYHVYDALSGQVVEDGFGCTVSGTCWRHETGRFTPLERGWAFTMQEAVRVGPAATIREFRGRGMAAAEQLARRLGLRPAIEPATDPFFAPQSRGRAVLQRVKSLKHELLLPLGDGRTTAAGSFNDHARFFGDAFEIRLGDGSPAATGCVAFGVERWLLAVLVEHGPDAAGWPLADRPRDAAVTIRRNA